jgi:hypothetical protein
MFVAYRKSQAQKAHHRHETRRCRIPTIVATLPPPVRSAMDLEQALGRAISERTGGRIYSLQVRILGGRVVLHGWAGSYHAVQLALAGLFEAFHAMNLDRPEDVELDIDVLYGNSSS